ncbi:hypothetical protein I3843_09G149000 [Carya illinoinensis]|nr:hypothetical protein I3760_09G150800 [Carya illinoinensis]KAG7964047.1 hypothetical protein I3843_09G149000 [Carya illinoinensis]
MAYYSSSYYEDDLVDRYNQTPYESVYDSAPTHDFMPYSSYDSSSHQFFEHNSIPYYGAFNPPHSTSSIAYSTSTFSEPRFIEYDPNPYGGSYKSPHTHFVISYSAVEFNIPEFEDYDPEPYNGGYDIAQTYGKPLPASDEICYPRMTTDPNALFVNGVTLGSITLPSEKEEIDGQALKPSNGTEQPPQNEEGLQLHGGSDKDHDSHKEEPYQGETGLGNASDDYHPQAGYGSGYGNGAAAAEEHGYQYDNWVPSNPPPSGYGLEAMDLCESLFGYWPCISREKRRGYGQECAADEGSNKDLWKGTADYLFGSSYPYGERRDVGGSYGVPNYDYERHYQQQPLYMQADYDEDSWLN